MPECCPLELGVRRDGPQGSDIGVHDTTICSKPSGEVYGYEWGAGWQNGCDMRITCG